MNEKKKKIEKELTKYDVDRDTQAKALNVQHLAQMPKYLPLFTKKIKDPKAIKKQKATKELDYTKHKKDDDQGMRVQIREGVQEKAERQEENVIMDQQVTVEEIPQNEQQFQQTFQEEFKIDQEAIEIELSQKVQEPKTFKRKIKKKNSPKQKSPIRSQPKEDIEGKLSLAEREHLMLRQELNEKKEEYDRVNFKYAKAQSQFIEIMRELSRFRDEFNDSYSIRSKLKIVKQVTHRIDDLVKSKDVVVAREESQLQQFRKQEGKLFEKDSPQVRSQQIFRKRCSVSIKNQAMRTTAQNMLHKNCNVGFGSNSRVMRINNIRCIVNYQIDKKRAECSVKFYTQAHHDPFTYTFEKITEKFNPWDEISKFQFRTVQNEIQLEYVQKKENEKPNEHQIKYIEMQDEDSIYFQVNNVLLKYVHGSPMRINTLSITNSELKQSIALTIMDKEFNQAFSTVEIPYDKLFKDIVPSYLQSVHFDDYLSAILFRSEFMEQIISKYVKRYLQIGDFEASPLSPTTANKKAKNRQPLQNHNSGNVKYAKLSIFDRESKGIKARRKSFAGVRISNTKLGNFGGNTLNLSHSNSKDPLHQRRTSTVNQNMKNSAYYVSQFEKMKDAVIAHIQKKKDQEKSTLNSHLVSPKFKSPGGTTTAEKIARLKFTNAIASDHKMAQIMKLIYANSMYVTVHFELFIVNREDFPVYLELVHNTDDDSIILFIVQDPKELGVSEVKLDNLENFNWQIIKRRFGESSEHIIINIETIFRTLEFLNIIKNLIQLQQQSVLGTRNQNSRLQADLMSSPGGKLKKQTNEGNSQREINFGDIFTKQMVEQKQNFKDQMEYRYVGNSGLRVSIFAYGNWLNSDDKGNYEITRDSIKLCYENGINFFDTAELYGSGEAEVQMGRAIKELGYNREELVISTKFFWGTHKHQNAVGLSRKHIMEAAQASLQRLGLDYVDIVFCHRPDFDTPLEETCRAMNTIIEKGWVHYWGTSEWPADRIAKAIELCDKYNLHKPIAEQPEYSMIKRNQFEKDYKRIFSENGYGSTIWSPLAGGVLAGKYNDGKIPEGSRYDNHKQFSWIFDKYMGEHIREEQIKRLNRLAEIAKELGYTQAQLALAWAIANPNVSTCLLGFTRLSQVEENLKALELYHKWDNELENKVENALGNSPAAEMNWKTFNVEEQRRSIAPKKRQV